MARYRHRLARSRDRRKGDIGRKNTVPDAIAAEVIGRKDVVGDKGGAVGDGGEVLAARAASGDGGDDFRAGEDIYLPVPKSFLYLVDRIS